MMKKFISVDVVELEQTGNKCSGKKLYMNRCTKPVLINLDMIAELWPTEEFCLTKLTSIVNDRNKIIGTINLARLYTSSGRRFAADSTETCKYITEESYKKICNEIVSY